MKNRIRDRVCPDCSAEHTGERSRCSPCEYARRLARGDFSKASCSACGRGVQRGSASLDAPICRLCRSAEKERRRTACEDRHGRPMRAECAQCRGARLDSPKCATNGCARYAVGRGLCNTHYRSWGIKVGRYVNHRMGHGYWILPEDRLAIYERDGWTCQLCGEPTSRRYSSSDPLSPTLDHRVPYSLGGTNDSQNLQLAHAICNSTRGAKVLE